MSVIADPVLLQLKLMLFGTFYKQQSPENVFTTGYFYLNVISFDGLTNLLSVVTFIGVEAQWSKVS